MKKEERPTLEQLEEDAKCFESSQREKQKNKTFEQQLSDLINRESLENISDTPDFILARYLCLCLTAYHEAVVNERKPIEEMTKRILIATYLGKCAKAYAITKEHKAWWFRPQEEIDSPLPDLVQEDEEFSKIIPKEKQ